MWAHNERNVSERGMFVSSVSIITLDPELAPLVSYLPTHNREAHGRSKAEPA